MRGKLITILIFLITFGFSLANAGEDVAAEEEAIRVAKCWLAQVDEGKYAESWDGAAPLFKDNVTKEQWQQTMKTRRSPLGAKVARDFSSSENRTSLPGVPDGRYVVVQFKSSFTNKAIAIETVTPILGSDGKWRVAGYYLK